MCFPVRCLKPTPPGRRRFLFGARETRCNESTSHVLSCWTPVTLLHVDGVIEIRAASCQMANKWENMKLINTEIFILDNNQSN